MNFLEPMEFEDALDVARAKSLLPTSLSSRELSRLPGELKRRSTFSARVAMAEHLQRLGKLVENIAGGVMEDVTGADGTAGQRLTSITEAKAQLKEYLDSIGYQPDPDDAGTLKDLSSDARLQLQVETNVLDTLGYGRWTASQDTVALDVNPAWELVRMRPAKLPRDWEARWQEARGNSTADGATDAASGRMVALKNHPIWDELGNPDRFPDALGNPWPPFAFNSGMNVVDVPRAEAIALGLLSETTEVQVDERGLNGELAVDADRFEPALLEALASDPNLVLRDGVLTLR